MKKSPLRVRKVSLPLQILVALALGVLVGAAMQSHAEVANTYIKPIGTVFLNLIKLVIVPLVFSSLVVGVAELDDAKRIGKIGFKTIVFFLATTCIAILIGLIFANIFQVGSGFALPSAEKIVYEAKEAPSFVETLVGIIPANPLKALVDGNMLQIIVFALILGGGLLSIGEKGEPVFRLFSALTDCMITITNAIMRLAPMGVFGLIVPVIASSGISVLLPLMKVILVVYFACFVHMMLIYTGSIRLIARLPVGVFLKKAFSPWMMAFTTSSSAGTLPYSLEVAEQKLGVSRPIASFVLPLGATVNMDGTSIYQGVCALFIAQAYGMQLTLAQQATILLTATLASIGTAGVPGAGMIMLAMVLQGVGVPVEGIALVAGVDRIFDMIRTSVNVLGDITCSVVVAKTEGALDESVFYNRHS